MAHHHDHLGVHKLGRNIKKVPTNHHQPQSQFQAQLQLPPQPQPQLKPRSQPVVYNISKTEFRSFVQRLTGSGSNSTVNPSPKNQPKPSNSRLVKVRPAPLTQLNRQPPPLGANNSTSLKPDQVGPHGNPAESPISAYMRYLTESSPVPNQSLHQNQPPNRNPFQPSSDSQKTSSVSHFLRPSSLQSPLASLPPNFRFSPTILGGGGGLPPPASPGLTFSLLSPSEIFQILSPRWKTQ